MSTHVSYIIHRASEMVGLKNFESDTMDDDNFRKVFYMVCDAIRGVNQQDSIAFSNVTIDKQVTGDTLIFQPYTEAEQSIIDGGGTVDITNRIVDIRPTIAPVLYRGSDKLTYVDYLDLPSYSDGYFCSWNPDWDKDIVKFGNTINSIITCQIRKPVKIPTLPSQYIEIPERMNDYLICLVAYNIASVLGMTETLPIIKANLDSAKKLVTVNNRSTRPVYLDTTYRFC